MDAAGPLIWSSLPEAPIPACRADTCHRPGRLRAQGPEPPRSWSNAMSWPVPRAAASAIALAAGCREPMVIPRAIRIADGGISSALVREGRPSVRVPGLVEGHAVDLGQALEGGAVLDHDAALEQAARGHDLHDGHRQAQRARAGDDQHGDGDGDRRMPVPGERTASPGRTAGPSCGRRANRAPRRGRPAAGSGPARPRPPPSSGPSPPGTSSPPVPSPGPSAAP